MDNNNEGLTPDKAKDIVVKIGAVAGRHGYKVYAVGGFVRDELLDRLSKDLDIVAINESDGVLAGIHLAALVGCLAPALRPTPGSSSYSEY